MCKVQSKNNDNNQDTMTDPKTFDKLSFETLIITENTSLVFNSASELYYYESDISIPASQTVTVSVSGIFFETPPTTTRIAMGVIKIIARSRTHGTVKCVNYPFTTVRAGTTIYQTIGTLFNQTGVQLTGSQTGGTPMTAVRNGALLDVTLDLTDTADVVTDGELFVYLEKHN